MNELHDKRGAKVLDFDLISPHEQARLKCSVCGNVAQHVWPSKTPMTTLVCVCGLSGTLNYDLPETPCEHGAQYQWSRMTEDGAVTVHMCCIGCEFNAIAKVLSAAGVNEFPLLSDGVRVLADRVKTLSRPMPHDEATSGVLPHVCGLCGQRMPKGEEMFKFHGYSGPCPR